MLKKISKGAALCILILFFFFFYEVLATFLPIPSICIESFNLKSEPAKADQQAREWLHHWPSKYDWQTELSFVTVPESHTQEAERLLNAASAVALTEAKVLELGGESNWSRSLGTPYLLRAVGAFNKRHYFQVMTRQNGDIWVGGGAQGPCPSSLQLQRQAVIIWLNQPPHEVYVTFVRGR